MIANDARCHSSGGVEIEPFRSQYAELVVADSNAVLVSLLFLDSEGLEEPRFGGVEVAPLLGDHVDLVVRVGCGVLVPQLLRDRQGFRVPPIRGVEVTSLPGHDTEFVVALPATCSFPSFSEIARDLQYHLSAVSMSHLAWSMRPSWW